MLVWLAAVPFPRADHLPRFCEGSMKDGFLLLLTGLVCAAAAWAFWHYLGDDAVAVLMCVALVSTVADNIRLRRKLKDRRR
jgi:hypothetical protein